MFQQLQKKWKVNGVQFFLVFSTFALGGSFCGYIGKKLIILLPINDAVLKATSYILLVTFLWPICVLFVSVFTGQFGFFKNYIHRLLNKIFRTKKAADSDRNVISIAVFASGTGSNTQKLIEFFSNHSIVKIKLIVCNKPKAGVIDIAHKANIDVLMIEKDKFIIGDAYIPELIKEGIDWIVLAGFLWKIPKELVKQYPNKIINIHPALLPNYGGKGMYGNYVHMAVLSNHETESGITIHFVNENYDEGAIIFQAKCAVDRNDTADTLAQKIHALEHKHFPVIVEKTILNTKNKIA